MADVASAATDNAEYFDFYQSLHRLGYIKLLHDCMCDRGPAAQTLGGLLAISTRETYVSNQAIADHANLPLRTVKHHIAALSQAGWVTNDGRQRTNAGRLRRTATRCVTSKAKHCTRYGVLPNWTSLLNLKWAERAVFSLVMARALAVGSGVNATEAASEVDSLGDLANGHWDRFGFSLRQIERQTGLGRAAIATAKRSLAKRKLVARTDGDGDSDTLFPSPSKAIKVWQDDESSWCCVRDNPDYEGWF